MAVPGLLTRKNMIAVPAGHFLMGSDDHYPEERPAHDERVAAFLIDEHPVTNAEFRRFVNDTGYVTTAETAPAAEDFPDADPADLVSGSLVFRPTRKAGAAGRLAPLVALDAGRDVANARRSRQQPGRPRTAPGRARLA